MKKPEAWPPYRVWVAWTGPIGSLLQFFVWPQMPETMQAFPWANYAPYLWCVSAAFAAADVLNSEGYSRRWWRWWLRYFDVPQIIPVHSMSNGLEAVEPTASLIFVRKARDASLVVEIDGCMTRGGNIRQPASFVCETNRTFARGERYKLPLAFIPLKTYPSGPLPPARYSGAHNPTGPHLVAGSVNVLTIVLRSGWRSQKYRVHVRRLMADSGTHARFFWMGEDYDPFKDGDTGQAST